MSMKHNSSGHPLPPRSGLDKGMVGGGVQQFSVVDIGNRGGIRVQLLNPAV